MQLQGYMTNVKYGNVYGRDNTNQSLIIHTGDGQDKAIV